ncbi:hypothetical protein ACVWXP_006436 [Bradyrhizobium sp. USDA 4463]
MATEAQKKRWAQASRNGWEAYNSGDRKAPVDVSRIFDDIGKVIIECGGRVTSLPSHSEVRFEAPVDTPIAEHLAAIRISPGFGQPARVLALRVLGDGQRINDGRLSAVRRYAFSLSRG